MTTNDTTPALLAMRDRCVRLALSDESDAPTADLAGAVAAPAIHDAARALTLRATLSPYTLRWLNALVRTADVLRQLAAGEWNFFDADLTDANLTDANLTRANLTDADLTDANLTRAKNLRPEGMPDALALRAQVAAHIRANPELHDQTEWGDGDANPACGTPCCVADWACHLGGGRYGMSVPGAATVLLGGVEGYRVPDFSAHTSREEILEALDDARRRG